MGTAFGTPDGVARNAPRALARGSVLVAVLNFGLAVNIRPRMTLSTGNPCPYVKLTPQRTQELQEWISFVVLPLEGV